MWKLWPPRARPAAGGLCIAALIVFLWWWLGDVGRLDAWTPNIVVGLVGLAATITFVESIVQREASLQMQPRVDRAKQSIRIALFFFLSRLSVYFVGTRPNWYRPEYPAFVEDDYPSERYTERYGDARFEGDADGVELIEAWIQADGAHLVRRDARPA